MSRPGGIEANWHEDFFRGIVLDFWRIATPPEQTRLEAAALERLLRLRAGDRVLDVPCGLGRHSLELAGRGYRMTGVDGSSEAIDEARRLAAAAGVGVEWRSADMRDLPWPAEFDAAFCFGNSFGYLEPPGTRAFVQAVARALKPGARFALDTGMAAECILPHLRDREWAEVGEFYFLEENRYHATEGCFETVYTFVRDGETLRRSGFHWVHTIREIRSMLADAGLVEEGIFGSIDGEPFRMGSRYLVLVARKA